MTATLVHASCIAIGGRAVLISGRSGSGKSDLALRLIDRGAGLVSDDYTALEPQAGWLLASAPERIAGKLEIRGIGIVDLNPLADVPVALLVDLDLAPERMPDSATRPLSGIKIPVIGLAALEASAPIKVESALLRFGLPLS